MGSIYVLAGPKVLHASESDLTQWDSLHVFLPSDTAVE